MNSLVVFLSVVALVAGKPSGLLSSPILSYSAPIVAAPTVYSAPAAVYSAPAAVSSQSRLDIKTSPAVVATAAIAPLTRTVITEPALVAAPAIATAAIAPAAVSSQSRIDIKSTPAITSTVLSSPIAYSAPVAYGASYAFKTPILAGAVAPAYLKTAYAAPSLIKSAAWAPASAAWAPAFAAPAAIAGPAVPLDTPEVIAARAAHFEAKALTGAHLIKKRSVSLYGSPLVSSPLISTYAAAPLLSTVHAAPLAYSAPIALSTPLITKAYGVHPW